MHPLTYVISCYHRLGHEEINIRSGQGNTVDPVLPTEDLDFADDLAVISSTHAHLQKKTSRLNTFAKQVGLIINRAKTQVMCINAQESPPVNIEGENLTAVEDFCYLGSHISTDGGLF